MLTNEIRAYVKDMLLAGHSADDIRGALRGQGWDEDDITLLFHESGGKIVPPPGAVPPATVSGDLHVDGTDAFSGVQMPIQGSGTSSAADLRGQKKRIGLILVVAILGLLLLGGGAFAYMRFFSGANAVVNAESVFAKMPAAMQSLTWVHIQNDLHLSGTLVPNSEMASLGITGTPEFNLQTIFSGDTTVNTATLKDKKIDGVLTLSGVVNQGYVRFNIEAEFSIRVLNETLYLRAVRFPEIPGLEDYAEELTGKWIALPLGAATSSSDGLLELSPLALGAIPDLSATATEEVARSYRDAVLKYPIFTISRSERLNDGEFAEFHYVLKLDQENLHDLFIELVGITNKSRGAEGPYRSDINDPEQVWSEVSGVIVPILSAMMPELWIHEEDALLSRAMLNLAYATVTPYGNIDLKMTNALRLSNFNKEVEITAPTENVVPFEDIINDALGDARKKARDAKRISDLGMIQLALELYCDAHFDVKGNSCTYPATLEPLVTEDILPRMPEDPTDNKPYSYVPLQKDGRTLCKNSPCTAYHLGASLENAENVVLGNDKDIILSAAKFSGKDTSGCSNEAERYCYDIAP